MSLVGPAVTVSGPGPVAVAGVLAVAVAVGAQQGRQAWRPGWLAFDRAEKSKATSQSVPPGCVQRKLPM